MNECARITLNCEWLTYWVAPLYSAKTTPSMSARRHRRLTTFNGPSMRRTSNASKSTLNSVSTSKMATINATAMGSHAT